MASKKKAAKKQTPKPAGKKAAVKKAVKKSVSAKTTTPKKAARKAAIKKAVTKKAAPKKAIKKVAIKKSVAKKDAPKKRIKKAVSKSAKAKKASPKKAKKASPKKATPKEIVVIPLPTEIPPAPPHVTEPPVNADEGAPGIIVIPHTRELPPDLVTDLGEEEGIPCICRKKGGFFFCMKRLPNGSLIQCDGPFETKEECEEHKCIS